MIRKLPSFQIPVHRVVLGLLALALVTLAALFMQWDWLLTYRTLWIQGLWTTVWLLVITTALGLAASILLGIAQVTRQKIFSVPAKVFCTITRGTPALLQLWLLYFGLGALFPQIPWIRGSFLWPYLRQPWPYGVLFLTLSYAGYVGEVMRGAFASMPKGELDAARAIGMSRALLFRRIWLPQSLHRALPAISGETIWQLKTTPLVATITMVDAYSVATRVREETFITYEPLLFLAALYLIITGVLVMVFRKLEARIPVRVG
jgi:polar amino acid transport system permease protein